MKTILLSILLIIASISSFAQNEFITTWKTDTVVTAGYSDSTSICIPTNSSYTYNYDVDWENDGVFDTLGVTGSIEHDYGTKGTYSVAIRGTFPAIQFDWGKDALKILSIDQWGSIAWADMEYAFGGCENLYLNASDVPDLSGTTSLEGMFAFVGGFNSSIGSWDVSTIATFEYMFGDSPFNEDISGWNVSSANNLSHMFYGAAEFNQDISGWNVGTATDLYGMFRNATEFNQDIYAWDLSSAERTSEMFSGATSFNQDISGWDVSSVTSMSEMFMNATSFNQDISGWNVSNVNGFENMFKGASAFNQNLGDWDITKITWYTFMKDMFNGANLSTSNYDATLKGWATQNVFSGIDLGTVNSSYCQSALARDTLTINYGWTINDNGQSCENSDYLITTWYTDPETVSDSTISILTNSSYAYNYDIDLDNDGVFDTLGITGDFSYKFDSVGTYTIQIRGTFPAFMFNSDAEAAKLLAVNQWGTIQWQDMNLAFAGCENFNITATDTPDLGEVINMSYAFANCDSLNADLSSWDVSKVTDMSDMFLWATTFNSDISNWDVSSVTNMDHMFAGATNFNQPLNSWDVSNVTSMTGMFAGAAFFNQPLAGWNVGNVTNMNGMFSGNFSFDQDLSSWDVSKVTNMAYMFNEAYKFDQDISGWKVDSVTTMNRMFLTAYSFNQDLSNWNVEKVSDMRAMFMDAYEFDQSLGDWNLSGITGTNKMQNMFISTNLSAANYDATLKGWAQQTVINNINLGYVPATYCNAGYWRDILKNTYNWTISDDGQSCDDTDYFITTWKTDINDLNDTKISIPTNSTYDYNYDVDWDNDGVFDTLGITEDFNYDFGSAGTYTVQIRGTFPAIYVNYGSGRDKLVSIDQWGSITWTSMAAAFKGCSNLEYNATDIPDLAAVTDMSQMFFGDTLFNGDITAWDVSNVTTMRRLFYKTAFNQDISNWDVSQVTNMEDMFYNATSFNQNIGNWDVSKVTDISGMFRNASDFNQDISNWKLDSAFAMSGMFYGATSFNQDISTWDVSNVQYMSSMFYGATNFNQNISNWDISNVTVMNQMFDGATAFDQNLGAWDITGINGVSNMNDMFKNSGISLTNYDSTLIGWATQDVYPGIYLGTVPASYCKGAAAHDTLTITYGWSIDDNGLETDAPEPDMAILDDIEAEYEVTSLTPPTATDCIGSITGTHDVTLPITTQGTTVVTWTYEDGHGNITTQTQNVVIEDVTNPVLTCVSDKEVIIAGEVYEVKGAEFDPEGTSDNCGIASILNDFTNTETLAGAKLPIGTNSITWTITDKTGNTASCTFHVTVNKPTGIESLSEQDIMLYPNPAKDYIFVKGLDNEDINNTTVNIYSINGKMVYQNDLNQDYKINIAGLEPGTYFIQIQKSNEIKTLRLMKSDE
jgi:surface protein